MIVEIDQSGKLEQLDTDTAIAFSNSTSSVMLLKAGTKRRIVRQLRKTLIPQKELFAILYAIIIFLILSDSEKKKTILIDEEYTGKNKIITETLEKLYFKQTGKVWPGIITFGQIGKHSNAHKLAWTTHRSKKRVGIRTITQVEIGVLLQ